MIKVDSLTQTEINKLTPESGLIVFNSTLGIIQKCENGQWKSEGANATLSGPIEILQGTAPIYGVLTVDGKIIAVRDNGSSLALKGLSEATSASAGAAINDYHGIFHDVSYNSTAINGLGTKKNRTIFGGNYDMDVEIQSPHQLRLVGGDNAVTGGAADSAETNGVGNVLVISRSDIKLSPWAAPESVGQNYLKVTAVTETVTDTGAAYPDGYVAGEVVVKANAGNLHLNKGSTTGGIGIVSMTQAQKQAIVKVVGTIVFDTTLHKLCVYTGEAGGASTGWETITSVLE